MLFVGPDISLYNANTATLMVCSDAEGTVTITSVPPATHDDTVTIGATLKEDFTVRFGYIGTYVITATKGVDTDTCTVNVDTDKCLVHGTIVDVLGNPLRNSEVTFSPESNGTEMSILAATAYTNHLGYFAIKILREITCVIHAKGAAYKKLVTIPDANSVDIKDL
jgi:hypothetical protein